MIKNKRISVVIPVHNVGKSILEFLNKIPDYVDLIFLIDDKCPLKLENCKENFPNLEKLKIIMNEKPWCRWRC